MLLSGGGIAGAASIFVIPPPMPPSPPIPIPHYVIVPRPRLVAADRGVGVPPGAPSARIGLVYNRPLIGNSALATDRYKVFAIPLAVGPDRIPDGAGRPVAVEAARYRNAGRRVELRLAEPVAGPIEVVIPGGQANPTTIAILA